MADSVVALKELGAEEVPERLRASYYFDFDKNPFEHSDLFETGNKSVIDAIAGIDDYVTAKLASIVTAAKEKCCGVTALTEKDFSCQCVGAFQAYVEEGAVFEPAFVMGVDDGEPNAIYVAKGAKVLGSAIFLNDGCIAIGEDTMVEPGVGVKGPTIIGKENEIRQGAYFRGDCITGNGCVLRGELKNTVIMDGGNFPHPSYLGDSLCGSETHFGNQATSANLGIFAVISRDPIVMDVDGTKYDLGRPKVGIIMGDFSQVGCNSVSDPGTFLAPWTIVYQLTRLNRGFYGPNELLKNKPLEHGIIERSPLNK